MSVGAVSATASTTEESVTLTEYVSEKPGFTSAYLLEGKAKTKVTSTTTKPGAKVGTTSTSKREVKGKKVVITDVTTEVSAKKTTVTTRVTTATRKKLDESADNKPQQGVTKTSIKIGSTQPITGVAAIAGQGLYAGVKLAVDEINAKGGLGGKYKAVIDVRDTRSDTAEAVKVAQEFADKKVNFIVSPADGDPTMAMGQITSPAGIPTMTFAGTAPVLTSVGDFVFGSYPGDNQQAAVLGAYAVELGYKTAWLLKSPDSSYTMKGPEYFGQVFEAKGGKVIGEGSFTLNQPDFSAIVTTIKALDPQPDVIATWAWEPDFPAFIKALRGAGVTTPVMGADVLDTPTVRGLGEVVNGIIHTSGGYPEPGSKHEDFNKRFKAATGMEADTN